MWHHLHEEKSPTIGLNPDDRRWLEQAVVLAEQTARSGGVPFAALVVAEGSLIGQGVNRVRVDHDPTAHAEIVAIRDACRRLRAPALTEATLVASAEPCALCLVAAAWAGIDRVLFAADAETAAAFGFDYLSSRRMIAPPGLWPLTIEHAPIAGADAPFRPWAARQPSCSLLNA